MASIVSTSKGIPDIRKVFGPNLRLVSVVTEGYNSCEDVEKFGALALSSATNVSQENSVNLETGLLWKQALPCLPLTKSVNVQQH